jgi:amidase
MRSSIDPFTPAVELAAAIRRKEVSPVEVASCHLEPGSDVPSALVCYRSPDA